MVEGVCSSLLLLSYLRTFVGACEGTVLFHVYILSIEGFYSTCFFVLLENGYLSVDLNGFHSFTKLLYCSRPTWPFSTQYKSPF